MFFFLDNHVNRDCLWICQNCVLFLHRASALMLVLMGFFYWSRTHLVFMLISMPMLTLCVNCYIYVYIYIYIRILQILWMFYVCYAIKCYSTRMKYFFVSFICSKRLLVSLRVNSHLQFFRRKLLYKLFALLWVALYQMGTFSLITPVFLQVIANYNSY